MSWSFNGQVDTSHDTGVWEEEVYDAKVFPDPPDEIKKEQTTATEWAKSTIIDVIDCGAVGSIGKKFSFSASGHSNPETEPKEGYGNDFITITVHQTKVD